MSKCYECDKKIYRYQYNEEGEIMDICGACKDLYISQLEQQDTAILINEIDEYTHAQKEWARMDDDTINSIANRISLEDEYDEYVH